MSSLLPFFLLCLTFLSSSSAYRTRHRPTYPVAAASSSASHNVNMNSFNVPTSNGTTSLPSPYSNFTVKAITLGRGTQNYTCATNTAASKPVSIGAIATLFNATPLLLFVSAIEAMEILSLLPSYLVSIPLSTLTATLPLDVLGHHYFADPTTPSFDLGSTGFLAGAKAGDIAAPKAGSSPGPDGKGNGAVDWLELGEKTGSVALGQGYRVWTAGGKPPVTCAGMGPTFEMDYSAQYWFFGQ